MNKWHYVQDVKKEKSEAFLEQAMKKSPSMVYGIGVPRSNNPGMVGVYRREKDKK